MALQTFDVCVKSAAAFERHFSRRTRAHFEKRLRQRRAAIVGRLRQLCETPFDGSRHTWPRNDARQLVCVFFRLVVKFEAARARNRFFSVEFPDVLVPNMGCRKGLLAMRTSNDAFVREFRVVFESSLAEKMRSVAFGANEAAMRLFVCDHLFFVFEDEVALVARKARLAHLEVRVVLHLRR